MKTFSAKPNNIARKWYIIDASKTPLGRLATEAAILLKGKHKVQYTPHLDCGDYVIIINSDKLVVTGDKLNKKIYYRHSGYPGGIKQISLSDLIKKDSTLAVRYAIRGMLPANKLRDNRLKRLKIYKDDSHNHSPQKPVVYELKDNQ